jgi:TetR/AcrR family transcriptional regulator, transcriptional repressor of bet genes
MRAVKRKSAGRAQIPRARHAHSRQRQRLIDACISALHIYGPSRTTVEKVVAIAKMSPGIVRFYFASKAAMLVASLQFLAAEFEEQLLVPVARLKSKPVAALELMVDLYLDPEIASPRKVSVWYSFWGEASSRQEYYDICGQKDEGFAVLVHELIERLIIDTAQPQLDPKAIALGLMGTLEMLWQEFAFRTEADIDRAAAKRRCMDYLRSIFPGQFASRANLDEGASGGAPGAKRLAAWTFGNARLFAQERERVFQEAWQLVGLGTQIPNPGDFIAADLGIERPLVVRDQAGRLRAYRNSCTEAAHSLTAASTGNLSVITCAVHGLQFDLDGKRRGGPGSADLSPLDLRLLGDLILIRRALRAATALNEERWRELELPVGLRLAGAPIETSISADWKLVVEQWLESAAAATPAAARGALGGAVNAGWSARRYAQLSGSGADFERRLRFVSPNHWVESRADGVTVLQVLPTAPGRSRVREHRFTLCGADRPAAALQYLAARLRPQMRRSMIEMAESTQQGLVVFGYETAQGTVSVPEAAAFRQYLLARIPALAYEGAPLDS